MKNLVIIAGPTAVGKTKLSIELAKKLNGEIISADSVQVYKGMNIGSAKITEEEKEGIAHHLIDILEPSEDFNVAEFKRLAKEAVLEIQSRGKLPILVGGTGFYIQALLYDIDFTEEPENKEIRSELEKIAETEDGIEILYNRLKEIDPAAAEGIHKNNVKRVIRAIEFVTQTGTLMSEHNEEQRAKTSPYNFCYFALTNDRKVLYDRIEKRIDIMINDGLVDEVKSLMEHGAKRDFVSMQGLGYKEIAAYLDGEITLEEAIYILKRDTRHFAKRQITWLKREPDVIWYDKGKMSEEDILKDMEIKIKE